MEEAKPIQALILDTNVLVSSLVKSEGITRVSFTILLHDENHEVMAPTEVIEELKNHAQEISRKAGITEQHLGKALDQLLVKVRLVPSSDYGSRLHEALRCVRDENDAPFAALAIAKSPSTIVTYNKRHFDSKQLSRRGVRLLTPAEAVGMLHSVGEATFGRTPKFSLKDLRDHRDHI